MEASNDNIKFKGRPVAFLYPKPGEAKDSPFQIVRFEEVEHISGPSFPPGIPNINDGRVTVVLKGNMPPMANRGEYIITCYKDAKRQKTRWQNEDNYRIADIRADCDFNDPMDIPKFCLFIMTEKQRDALLKVYPDPISILKNHDLDALRKVKGFGTMISQRILTAYDKAAGSEMAYIRLSQYGLTKNAIDSLIKWYNSPDIALEEVESNPYNLLKAPGYGWIKADAVALKQGILRNDPRRILAYAEHLLADLAETAGDSWVTIQSLFEAIFADCAPIDSTIMCDTIKSETMTESDFESIYDKNITQKGSCKAADFGKTFCYDEKGSRIGLLSIRLTEREIKRHLDRLKNAENDFTYNKEECLSVIHECEKAQGFSYTDEQYKSIWTMLDSNVTVLTGRAGCGKSTVLSAVAKIFSHFGIPMEQCALSGRASSNLTEITGVEGKTIHRLLGYIENKGFSYKETVPLPVKLVVLDETSMVGGPLFLSLISAIPTGAKFIMVGDLAQLDPIGGNAIFKDCIQSRYVPITELTEIHRQAAASGIIMQSLMISDGRSIIKNNTTGVSVRGDNHDFRIISTQDSALLQEMTIQEYKRMVEAENVNPKCLQVITPLKARGDLSCAILNGRIQNYLHNRNHINSDTRHISVEVATSQTGKIIQDIYVGDRVIVMKNDYAVKTVQDEETQIFNGNIGYVVSVPSDAYGVTIVRFEEQGSVCLTNKDLSHIQLAYAATVHKFQGTGIDYVIFAFDSSSYMLGSRELIYTALTRAKKGCSLICVPKLLNTFTHISKIKEKHTWLSSDLQTASSGEAMGKLFGKEGN